MTARRWMPWAVAVLVLLSAVQLLAHEHTHSHGGGHGHVHDHVHDHDHAHDHDDHHHDHRHWYSKPKEEVVEVLEEDIHNHVHDHSDHGHVHAHEDHGHVHDHEDHGHVHSHEAADHGHTHSHGGADHGHTHSHAEADHGHTHSHGEADHGHTHTHGEADHGHTDSQAKADHAHTHSHGGADNGHAHSHDDDDHGHVHSEIRPAYPVKAQREGVWGKAIGATAVVCAAPVFILPFIPIGNRPADGSPDKMLNTLLAFAAGGLLGDVFLHLLPHALDPHTHGGDDGHSHGHSHSHSEGAHDHSHSTAVGLWVMVGLAAFFVLEKAMRAYSGEGGHGHSHGHSHGDKKEAAKGGKDGKKEDVKDDQKEKLVEAHENHIKVAGYLNLVADFSHNFTDGLAIGASYLVSDSVGFTTTLAILMHEVPHEIGDFAILVQSGFTKQRAMMAQFSTAIGAMVGCVLGLMAKDLAESTLWVLPLTAGGFIYIATVSVLPELLNDTSLWQTIKELIAMAVGVAFMVVIAAYE